jgi:hypothetical protein
LFGAIQDIIIPVLYTASGQTRCIRTGPWFSQAKSGYDTFHHLPVPPLLLFVGSGNIYRIRSQQGAGCHSSCQSRITTAYFFRYNALSQMINTRSTIFCRYSAGHQSQFMQFFDRIPGKNMFFIPLLTIGQYLVIGKITSHLPNHFLFFAQSKIHLKLLLYAGN